MSRLSNYEILISRGCDTCLFGDKKKIEEMRKLHEAEDWIALAKLLGWCTYAFRLDLNEDGTKCNTHRELK